MRGVTPPSAPTSTSVCKTVSHCESSRSQGKRVPQFCLLGNFSVGDTSDVQWGKCRWEDSGW